MRKHHQVGRAGVALVSAGALALSFVTPYAFAQSAPPAVAARPATAAATAKPQEPDGGWPRDFATPSGGVARVFQPQVASWDGQRHMVAYAAVSFVAKTAMKPELGSVKLEADTSVAVAERLVSFSSLKMTEVHFPSVPNEQIKEITAELERAIKPGSVVIALDRVLARLDKSTLVPKNVEGVKADPPAIFFSTTPAVLVNFDGDPIWSPIEKNDLKFAVNTNWDLFEHTPTKALFLRHNDSWLTATDVKGPWKPAGKLPDAFAKLPDDENWKDVKGALPGRALTSKTTPAVFVSLQPAEMILLRGAPNYLLVQGTNLLWVSNTDGDVFRLGKGGPIYFLVAGRWFSAPDFKGPWTFATPTLPEDFKKIPLSHERSRVLAAVPGTEQAAEAVLLAQIPQTARVDKKTIQAPDVQYQGGGAEFQPIEKTTVSRAVNTDKDIIKVGAMYYMCYQGVWFMGSSPNGPWTVTGSVPGQIYEIPASSPAHAVTYVTVEEDHDDAVVFATAAAYTGVMIAWGCAVWGTGYYYPPYYWGGGHYPYYHPYYPTYGFGASYNPWTGAYTRSAVAYGPYGGAGVASRYNPRTGTYSRGAAAWGPYGARGVADAYNPRTGAYGRTRQGSNVYGSWGQTGVVRGDQWATTSRVTNNRTGTTTRVTRGSEGGGAITRNTPGPGGGGIARTGSGDVYAGRDGNVYRRQGDSWQKYDNGGWNGVQGPTDAQRQQAQQRVQQASEQRGGRSTTDAATMNQLNRDSAARSEGMQRTRDSSTARSSGMGSSYRPSTTRSSGMRSGGMRGGGGRRR